MMRSVASRLTCYYAGDFAGSAALGLVLVYFMTAAYLTHESDLALRQFRDEISAKFREMDPAAFSRDMQTETEARGTGEMLVRVVAGSGEVAFSSEARGWHGLPDPSSVLERAGPRGEDLMSRPGAAGGHDARMLYARIGDDHVVEIGFSERDHALFLRRLLWTVAVVFVLMVAAGALVGWAMARRAMSGVNAVTAAAARIAEGDMGHRVRVGREGREVQRLASTFNEMAARLETLIAKMKDSNDNIAHDLRSPVTRMRCNAEMPLMGAFGEEQYQEYAAKIIEDCDRLLVIVDTMLDISELEAGAAGFRRERVDLLEICREGAELFDALAEAQEKELSCRGEAPAFVDGDPGRLQRVVATLLDNAVKYTDGGCRIEIAVESNKDGSSFSVNDDGPGIAPEDLARVFERFYRADRSRSNTGNGLGLSLARAIVEAHGGRLEVRSRPGEGATFTATFPPVRS